MCGHSAEPVAAERCQKETQECVSVDHGLTQSDRRQVLLQSPVAQQHHTTESVDKPHETKCSALHLQYSHINLVSPQILLKYCQEQKWINYHHNQRDIITQIHDSQCGHHKTGGFIEIQEAMYLS